MITISLCMIVKNEQATLARCLDCLHSIVDELIIIDTGSTDATKSIASRYTDKVYDYQWCDDFAAARNFAISKATCDYIYMADADEVIDQENQLKFSQLKQALLPEVDIVQMKYANQLEYGSVYNFDEEYRPKLFKRVREFYYIDPIHETLQVDPVIYDSEIVIIHKPHESHASRDFKHFQAAIRRGERLSKRILNMYAKELYIAGTSQDFKDANQYFEQVLTESNRSVEELTDAFLVLAHNARESRDLERFFKYTMNLMSIGATSELCYELGEYYYERYDYREASIWFYNAAFETECTLSTKYKGALVLDRLADCYSALGDVTNAMEYRNLAKERS